MKKAIPYYRVSTQRQGLSGLGLEAQQEAVRTHAARFGMHVIAEFIEVESGRKSKRPVLKLALAECLRHNAVLVIAKLDRLARNVAFIAALMESGVDFIALDCPGASKPMLQMMAVFAEFQRDRISEDTKDALAAAKRRGVRLGRNGSDVLAPKNRKAADDFARTMRPVIDDLRRDGHTTVRQIAKQLKRKRVKTFTRQGKWHVTTVHSLLRRIENLKH